MSDVDLLVIGAGACGLAGAIAAHDAGLSVAIVEKRDRPGGNSSLSTGSIPGAGSKYQRAAGIADSPERMVADLDAVSGHHDADDLTELMAEQSAPLCEWLIDGLGARMELITAYKHVGHSVARLHAPRSRRGQDLVDDLLGFVSERGIPLAVGNPVDELIVEDGAVGGAVIAGEPVTARKVLLATNGFAASREMVREFCPEIAGAEYFGARGSTGEAVRWGRKLGAALGNMAAYQGYAAVAYPQGQLLSWTTIEKGGILVGADGRRFGNEDAGYSGFAPDVMAQGDFAWAVYDRRIHQIAALEEEYAEMAQMGAVRWAGTAPDLALAGCVDPAGLAEAVGAYNAAARGEADDQFGRRKFEQAPLAPPLAIVKVKPGLFHTQGGLLVDEYARVRREGGGVIANLFAGGGAAAGISGRTGAAGYASGNGLLTALGLGRIAGLRAAAEVTGAGMTPARRIARFAAGLRLEHVPARVAEAAKLHFLDALGVGLAASTVPLSAGWADAAGRIGGAGPATVLGRDEGMSATAAALANGALIHSLEYDDTHVQSVVHGSAVAASAALAAAEEAGADGARLLAGYIAAWEVMIRLGLAAPGAYQANGFQISAVGGALGAATAAAAIGGRGEDRAVAALGIAGSQASGLLEFLSDGSTVKALHPGWAAHTGIAAAALAEAGMTGPETVLEGRFGFLAAFARDAGAAGRLEELLADLEEFWHLPDASFKLYPCCHYIHSFLQALLMPVANQLTYDNFESLTCHVPPPMAPLICEPWERRQSPASGYDAKWGLAYCMAALMVTGRVDIETFAYPPDPAIIHVARRIGWTPLEPHQFPHRFEAVIEARLQGGTTLRAEVSQAPGGPGQPLREAEVLAKFRANAGRAMAEGAVEAVLQAILNLQDAATLGALASALRDVQP